MLVIEVWNGNVWKLAGRLKPGQQHTVVDVKRGDHLRLVVEADGTTVLTDSNSPLLKLAPGALPWERVLTADWLPVPMLCRLHHRIRSQRAPGDT